MVTSRSSDGPTLTLPASGAYTFDQVIHAYPTAPA
jgi:hypothetical protein